MERETDPEEKSWCPKIINSDRNQQFSKRARESFQVHIIGIEAKILYKFFIENAR